MDDQLLNELHELKRRNEAPVALIEMLDALISLDPELDPEEQRERTVEILAEARLRLERGDA